MNHINKYIKTISIASLGFLLMCSGAFAQGVTSNIAGYITLNIKGNNGAGTSAFSFLSVPLLNSVLFSGIIESINGKTISVSQANWSENEFKDIYYIEITSGDNTGISSTITSTSSNTLSVHDDLSSLNNSIVGASFVIRKYTTIADVFGAKNEAGLKGGGRMSVADRILIQNPENQSFTRYYYKNSGIGGRGWFDETSIKDEDEKSETIIYPGSGFIVERIESNDIEVIVSGIVQSNTAITPIEKKLNYISSHFPTDITLNQLFGEDGGSLTKGGSLNEADSVIVPQSNGNGYDIYFYKSTGPGSPGWILAGGSLPGPDQENNTGDKVIAKAGDAIIVNRSKEESPFNLIEELTF